MTVKEAQRSALNFLDYWKSKPGAAGRKLDWPATWRMWARKDAAKVQRNGPEHQQRRPTHIAEQAFEAAQRAQLKQQGGFSNDAPKESVDLAGYVSHGHGR